MKIHKLLIGAVFVSSTGFAISNMPLPIFSQHDNCGPRLVMTDTCLAHAHMKDDYCDGFKKFITSVSKLAENGHRGEYELWCWTILEDWHECDIPHPNLFKQCLNAIMNDVDTRKTLSTSCSHRGYNNAKEIYLERLNTRCRSNAAAQDEVDR